MTATLSRPATDDSLVGAWLHNLIAQLHDTSRHEGISSTAYDTAWIASIPSAADPRIPEYPQAYQWLLDHQHKDGSWGGEVQYIHDRILCTLTALAALGSMRTSAAAELAIEAGTRYLWQKGHLLGNEPTELVAFELLLPAMVRRAQQADIKVPPHLDIYEAQRVEKMRLIPAGALYSPRVTVVHSLEFLGEQADLAGLKAAQGLNGSIGNSPAATACYYIRSRDPQAKRYLDNCLKRNGGAEVPVLHPCETYEYLWAAYHLYLAGIPAAELLTRRHRQTLSAALDNGGVSLAPTFPIPDADDTAVALLFLHDVEAEPDPRVLLPFATSEGHFASFQYERHSSLGVSLHVLHALLRIPGYPDRTRTIVRVLDYLASKQIEGLYWIDKWHVSPYYATAHALSILKELPRQQASRMKPLVERSREWLRHTQNADGSWGFYGEPTVEETAYGLLALAAGAGTPADSDKISSTLAAKYLLTRLLEHERHSSEVYPFPPLWIDKCLYTPRLIVQAVVVSALEAYRRLYPNELAKLEASCK
ncbi:MAG: hypothetical protein KDE09_04925 [Anaerolineales bacterium]|nr:hypothetical protein [Anaerolineales bacterium]MCB0006201.1 hypothetical protein [Anaerolineales bacterium]MCB0010844.1 hypothetical protein [Anaerolineales bacterium]MCB0017111.1 hypothetical protein [Anaerolineales bacterium]MCB8959132.1 hypothetical protein [Ardenticatenales bacterium]